MEDMEEILFGKVNTAGIMAFLRSKKVEKILVAVEKALFIAQYTLK
jgi:hypothetical protein